LSYVVTAGAAGLSSIVELNFAKRKERGKKKGKKKRKRREEERGADGVRLRKEV
jgi:hypothetical protein